jgi:hypothetical protein
VTKRRYQKPNHKDIDTAIVSNWPSSKTDEITEKGGFKSSILYSVVDLLVKRDGYFKGRDQKIDVG